MLIVLAKNWWLIALRGLLAVLFGLATFVWPQISLLVLVLLFGAYALVDGIFSVIAAARAAGNRERSWWLIFEGIAGIAAGIVTMVWPAITALVLVFLIAAWALITGIFEIIAAVRLRQEIDGEWMLVLAGVASVAFGLALALFPGAGALAVVWLIGAYALVFGVLLVALGFRLRGLQHRAEAYFHGTAPLGAR